MHSTDDFDLDFDVQAADKADVRGPARIDTSGMYLGKLTTVYAITASTGTKGLQLEFKDNAGASAEIKLYHTKADRTRTQGYDQIQALLRLLGLTKLKGVAGVARQYVNGAWDEEAAATVYPDLCNKPIGVVLRKRLYDGKKGDGFSFDLEHFFDAATGQTGSERAAGKPAAKIAQALLTLKDKDERRPRQTVPASVADDITF